MATHSDDIDLLKNCPDEYGEKFYDHYLEQYRLYVEMADRISARRLLANSFFLTIHTSVIAALVIVYQEGLKDPHIWLLVPLIGIELLCVAWWQIVKSYRQLNTGKYKVIHHMEKNLPCSPYDAEWTILGRGDNPKLYRPITHIENWVPLALGVIYILMSLMLFIPSFFKKPINNVYVPVETKQSVKTYQIENNSTVIQSSYSNLRGEK